MGTKLRRKFKPIFSSDRRNKRFENGGEYTRTRFDKEMKILEIEMAKEKLIMVDVQGQPFIWQLVDIGNHSGSCPSALPRVERKGEGRS